MLRRLGDVFTADELKGAPHSVITIGPAGDECDDEDVNLPKPACQAINKVCKYYNAAKQYLPYRADGSEQKNYQIRVHYEQPQQQQQQQP